MKEGKLPLGYCDKCDTLVYGEEGSNEEEVLFDFGLCLECAQTEDLQELERSLRDERCYREG